MKIADLFDEHGMKSWFKGDRIVFDRVGLRQGLALPFAGRREGGGKRG